MPTYPLAQRASISDVSQTGGIEGETEEMGTYQPHHSSYQQPASHGTRCEISFSVQTRSRAPVPVALGKLRALANC
jgi:hypothetical protein